MPRNPPPPRTQEERNAARAERERRRAARRGEVAPDPAPASSEEPSPAAPVPAEEPSFAAPAPTAPAPAEEPSFAPGGARRRARNTVIFSVLTGFSRVAGLVRELVARSYFGDSGAMSEFPLAFQVPNLSRAFAAD
ncbi:MAG: hypothetical protein ACR2L8_16610, partial [Solirubrobacteraceae bacterium]